MIISFPVSSENLSFREHLSPCSMGPMRLYCLYHNPRVPCIRKRRGVGKSPSLNPPSPLRAYKKSPFHYQESRFGMQFYCLIFLTIYFEDKVNILFSPGPMLFGEKLEFDFQFKINSFKNWAVSVG